MSPLVLHVYIKVSIWLVLSRPRSREKYYMYAYLCGSTVPSYSYGVHTSWEDVKYLTKDGRTII